MNCLYCNKIVINHTGPPFPYWESCTPCRVHWYFDNSILKETRFFINISDIHYNIYLSHITNETLIYDSFTLIKQIDYLCTDLTPSNLSEKLPIYLLLS